MITFVIYDKYYKRYLSFFKSVPLLQRCSLLVIFIPVHRQSHLMLTQLLLLPKPIHLRHVQTTQKSCVADKEYETYYFSSMFFLTVIARSFIRFMFKDTEIQHETVSEKQAPCNDDVESESSDELYYESNSELDTNQVTTMGMPW